MPCDSIQGQPGVGRSKIEQLVSPPFFQGNVQPSFDCSGRIQIHTSITNKFPASSVAAKEGLVCIFAMILNVDDGFEKAGFLGRLDMCFCKVFLYILLAKNILALWE